MQFGLLGHKIDYSLSPRIFSAIFDLLNIEGQFSVFDIPVDRVSDTINDLRELDGFSVTIPHKIALGHYLDSISTEAAGIGAVNSVNIKDGKLSGHNTDWIGFLNSIASYDYSNKSILILGCGGAARAVLYGLISKFNSSKIIVSGRNLANVSGMIEDISKSIKSSSEISGLAFDKIPMSGEYDLIINCTPVGSANLPHEFPLGEDFEFKATPLCFDLIYNPSQTVFLSRAAEAGCATLNGLPMLIHQALESFQIWSGDRLDRDKIFQQIINRLSEEQES